MQMASLSSAIEAIRPPTGSLSDSAGSRLEATVELVVSLRAHPEEEIEACLNDLAPALRAQLLNTAQPIVFAASCSAMLRIRCP